MVHTYGYFIDGRSYVKYFKLQKAFSYIYYTYFYGCIVLWTFLKCPVLLTKSRNLPKKKKKKKKVIAKLLGGTYIMQATKARFNASEVDATCQLCQSEHFIWSCSAHAAVRQTLLPQLQREVPTNIWKNLAKRACCLYILHPRLKCRMPHEFQTRILCYALHTNRSKLLETRATSTASAPDDTGCASP